MTGHTPWSEIKHKKAELDRAANKTPRCVDRLLKIQIWCPTHTGYALVRTAEKMWVSHMVTESIYPGIRL